uniref:riboflavin kinase n=2 Tax=Equus caballus TaxID=9796 RepID=A0A9L0SPG2_HORSE
GTRGPRPPRPGRTASRAPAAAGAGGASGAAPSSWASPPRSSFVHTFKEDSYGEILNVAIGRYLRPERNFDSLESLISAIQGDIEEAKKRLNLPAHLKL